MLPMNRTEGTRWHLLVGGFLLAVTAIASPAQTLTTLYSFCGQTSCGDGSAPYAAPVQGIDGNFYGTTIYGGSYAGAYGTIYKITPTGKLTTLYSFCGESACDYGAYPYAGLLLASNGELYGTTFGSLGMVFKITTKGQLTTVYTFCSLTDCADGEQPYAGLIQAGNGNFYGTTSEGGVPSSDGFGTVFELTPSGALTTLYSFCSQPNCTDGQGPYTPLVQATNGDFYGATVDAGPPPGTGTMYRITPTGSLTTLYTFCLEQGCPSGYHPSGLIQATDGDLYGTTEEGGAFGFGTVFKMTPGGKLTTLYSFCSQGQPYCLDGAYPIGGVIQATDGNFYGTTSAGGAGYALSPGILSGGTIFKITPSGTLTTLYNFCSQLGCTDGSGPQAGLFQATSGVFLGTTRVGGTGASNGTVFRLSVGLGPFVETVPTSGKVGQAVRILGTNLTGASSVTFNGIPAVVTGVSGSEITTTVPAGATTGTVQVTTPGGTLLSNVPFRVP